MGWTHHIFASHCIKVECVQVTGEPEVSPKLVSRQKNRTVWPKTSDVTQPIVLLSFQASLSYVSSNKALGCWTCSIIPSFDTNFFFLFFVLFSGDSNPSYVWDDGCSETDLNPLVWLQWLRLPSGGKKPTQSVAVAWETGGIRRICYTFFSRRQHCSGRQTEVIVLFCFFS